VKFSPNGKYILAATLDKWVALSIVFQGSLCLCNLVLKYTVIFLQMYKTSVYTLVNGNIKELTHRKQQNHERWYCSHHTDCVSMCCWIYHLLWFLLFSICEFFNVDVLYISICSFITKILLHKSSYSSFCPKFCCHGNQGGSGVKFNDTIRLAIPENRILEPRITTLSYTQPKLWPFKELFNFPHRRHCNFFYFCE